MKKLLSKVLLAAFALIATNSYADVVLSWNTFGNLGTETSEPSVSNDPNVAASTITLGPGITAAANGNRLGGNSWSLDLATSISTGDYFEFTLTPNSGFAFTGSTFDFVWDRSSTGPSSVTLRSSLDSYTADIGSVTGLAQGNTTTFSSISIASLVDVASAITFRLYGYGGTNASTGTGGFDSSTAISANPNIVLNGTVAAIPEPTSMAVLGCALAGGYVARRRSKKVVA